MTTQPTPATPSPASLASQEAATVTALINTLKAQGAADSAALTAYAAQWAGPAARWGVALAQAEADGDTVAVAQLTEDFAELTAEAVAMAADQAIMAQAAGETTLQAVVTTLLTYVAQFAAVAAKGAVVA